MNILITCGHTYPNGGSRGADAIMEGRRTLEIGKKIKAELELRGHKVTLLQEYTAKGWAVRNRNGYDIAISLHFNAFNKSVTGCEVLYKNANDKARAAGLSKYISQKLGNHDRGPKYRDDLYMLNIGFDALLEFCFHDAKADCDRYKKYRDNVADIVATYIGGHEPAKPTPPREPEVAPKPNKDLWEVQVGAFEEKANADKEAAELVAKGFDKYVFEEDGFWKVQAGAFELEENAEKLEDRLIATGFKVYVNPGYEPTSKGKTLAQHKAVAIDIINSTDKNGKADYGGYGTGPTRYARLEANGYDSQVVQDYINDLV